MRPQDAWPEYFLSPEDVAFPGPGVSISEDFEWEQPTEESYQSDLSALLAASEHISVRDEAGLPPLPPLPASRPPLVSESVEWT